MHKLALTTLSLTLLLPTFACSDDGGSGGGTGGATSTTASAGGAGGGASTSDTSTTSTSTTSSGGAGGAEPGECEGPGAPSEKVEVVVEAVTAKLVDVDGNPAAEQTVELCGLDICKYGTSDASGNVSVVGDDFENPAFKYGDRFAFGRLAIPLRNAGTLDLGTLVVPKLPADGPMLEAGKAAASGDVQLEIAEGAVIVIDDFTYEEPAQQKFRAAEMPVDKLPEGEAKDLGFEAVYVVAPVETHFCPAAKLTVPNGPAWPAGTEVEVYALGLDIGEEFASFGRWTKVSDAKVSEDGATVSTNDGEGLPILTAFGLRKKP